MDSLRVLAAGSTEGLQAIHADKLTHRDLKPADLLVAQDGPRIIDFGIARPGEGTQITNTGAILGTPSYMAPEQVKAKDPQVSPAVDMFALGTVLYFAATGSNPFKGDTVLAGIGLLLTTSPEVPKTVPEPVRTLITECWRRVPEERITAEKVLAMLDEAEPNHTWPPQMSSTGKSIPHPASEVWSFPLGPEGLKEWPTSQLLVRAEELGNEAETLLGQRRAGEAVKLAVEEVALRGALTTRHPEVHTPGLAQALGRQAEALSELRRTEEALDARAKAIKLLRALPGFNPDTHTPKLVALLDDHSVDLYMAGQHEESVDVFAQATVLLRTLVRRDPIAYLPELAGSLHGLSDHLEELGRYEEAVNAITEAVSLRRELALNNPKSCLDDFESVVSRKATMRERYDLP